MSSNESIQSYSNDFGHTCRNCNEKLLGYRKWDDKFCDSTCRRIINGTYDRDMSHPTFDMTNRDWDKD